MAQKVEVLLIDDLDGSSADETVKFGCGGASYEIDLNTTNAKTLREALGPFIENARKSGTTTRRRSTDTTSATSRRERSADVRAWAKKRGITINERGRIPASVIEQYEAAH